MQSSPTQAVSFGVFRLDFESGQLLKFGTPVRIKPQPLKLLSFLVQRPGELVTREEIQQELWGDTNTFVDFDLGLNHCVRQIRAVLGDDAAAPRYVETIPRRGYRFVAPVTPVLPRADSRPVQTAPPEPAAASTSRRIRRFFFWPVAGLIAAALLCISIFFVIRHRPRESNAKAPVSRIMLAVLPFENLTGDAQQEYLSDGVTDELIEHLSRFSPAYLGVIARTSAMKYKGSGKGIDQISRELGVSYLLEGSVKRNGSKLHISAELIQASDQTHLWAESYDSEVTGEQILALEEEVASRIARSLSIVLPETHNRRSTTANAAAYDDYLKGRYYWNRRTEDGFQQAIDHFQQAIAIDPNYAEPYAGLADAYNLFIEYFNVGSTAEFASRSKQAALKAVELDDSLAEGHAALAFNLWRYGWDFRRAESEFQIALEDDPNYANAHHWYGLYLASRGSFEQAKTELSQARGLDPLSLIIMTNAGWIDYFSRNFDASITEYREATSIAPDFLPALVKLSWAYEQKQMWREAADARQDFYRAVGHPSVADRIQRAYAESGYPAVLRFLLAEAHKPDRNRYYSDFETARMNALLGNEEQALADLQKSYRDRSGWLVFLQQEPAFDNLRKEAAFLELERQIKP